MTSAYPAVVREGDTVIWDINGDRQALITVDKNTCAERERRGKPYAARECRNELSSMLPLYRASSNHLISLLTKHLPRCNTDATLPAAKSSWARCFAPLPPWWAARTAPCSP